MALEYTPNTDYALTNLTSPVHTYELISDYKRLSNNCLRATGIYSHTSVSIFISKTTIQQPTKLQA